MSAKKPVMSVIVSIYNAEKTIEKCLEGIRRIDYDKSSMELILSNDASKDKTMDYVKNWVKQYQSLYRRVVVISPEEEGGVSVTRNRGLRTASGDYIVFVDSDVIVPENFFSLLKHFHNPLIGGVAAACPFEKNENIITDYYESMKPPSGAGEAIIGTGATIYSRKAIKNLEFEERIFFPSYEDGDFALSVMERGFKTITDPSVVSIHLRRTNFRKEMKVIYRKGVDLPLVLSKHPKRKNTKSMAMNLTFAFSTFLVLPFIFIFSFYYIKSARSLTRKKTKHAFIATLLSLSKAFGLVRGIIKWR
jgi:glycosyltransferase involved in cell wall biosynthesis